MGMLFNDFRDLDVPFSISLGSGVGIKNNNASYMFNNLNNYNAPFTIPDEVNNAYGMFYDCVNFNSPVHISPYSSHITTMQNMFTHANNFSQDINIPASCNYWSGLIGDGCYYNANIYVYSNGNGGYGAGNFAWAFRDWHNFNGNVIFMGVSPTNMQWAFEYDYKLNQNIHFPSTVENLYQCFYYCYNLNQNIQIPSVTHNCYYMFYFCESLNQNIRVPDNVDATYMFYYCTNLNQPIKIPNNSVLTGMLSYCQNLDQPFLVPYYRSNYYTDYEYFVNYNYYGDTAEINSDGGYIFASCNNLNAPITFDDNIESLSSTFASCYNFNQNVQMPSNLKFAYQTFASCYMKFNQNISFPEGIIEMRSTFAACSNFNQNIRMPSTVKMLSNCFAGCSNLNQNIVIPSGCLDTTGMFSDCENLNQNIIIPSSVKQVDNMFRDCSNYNYPVIIPEGVTTCDSICCGCYNLYMDEAVIPSTVNSWAYGQAFQYTKIINVNILTHNNYSGGVISLANAVDTAGKTPSGVHYDDLPWSHEDWQSFDFGIPIGYFKIPNDVCDESYWQYSYIRGILGGLEYTSFESYQQAKETRQDESYWPQYNHGGLFHYRFQDEGVWHEAVYYKDYPNATSEEDTDWYFYEVNHY